MASCLAVRLGHVAEARQPGGTRGGQQLVGVVVPQCERLQPLPAAQEPLRPAPAIVRLMRQGERQVRGLRPHHQARDSSQVSITRSVAPRLGD